MNVALAADRVRVVLSHTTHPGNIGACARAMKTMGLTRLWLVNPRVFPHPDATAMCSGADDVLAAARLCSSLDEALVGTVAQAAMTARRREMSLPVRAPREAVAELARSLAAGTGEVALVFGTESAGLTNEEVAMCSLPVSIPTNPQFASLNVAAAAQIMCYEMRLALSGAAAAPQCAPQVELARHEGLEQLYAELESALERAGFLDRVNPRRAMPRLRRLFGRTAVEKEELDLLLGAVKALGRRG